MRAGHPDHHRVLKEEAIEAQDFERAASFRDEEKRLDAERSEKESSWRQAEGEAESGGTKQEDA